MTAANNDASPMDGAPVIDFDKFKPTRSFTSARKRKDFAMKALISCAFIVALIPLFSVLLTTIINGVKRLNLNFLSYNMTGVVGGNPTPSGGYGGILHAIIGTLEITFGAMLISIPIGLMCAVYLVEYSNRGKLAQVITQLVDVMSGIPFIVAYNIISSVFRGMGDSKSPMYFIAVACFCNIVFDYLFMGWLRLGPSGAALGTTLAQAISVTVTLVAIRRRRTGIRLKFGDLRPDRAMLRGILGIGVPTAVQDGCIQIAFIIITVIANYRGLNDAAAVGVVEKVISALFLVPSSMLATVSAVSAQNIGAGRMERATKTLRYATAITVVYGIVISIVVELTAGSIVGLFTTDATVILLGTQYIRSYIVDSIFAGIHFCFSGFFAACGRSYIGFIHNIVAITLVRVPGAYLASKLFPNTLFPMGVAAPAGSLLSVLICLGFYAWLKRHGVISEKARA